MRMTVPFTASQRSKGSLSIDLYIKQKIKKIEDPYFDSVLLCLSDGMSIILFTYSLNQQKFIVVYHVPCTWLDV